MTRQIVYAKKVTKLCVLACLTHSISPRLGAYASMWSKTDKKNSKQEWYSEQFVFGLTKNPEVNMN